MLKQSILFAALLTCTFSIFGGKKQQKNSPSSKNRKIPPSLYTSEKAQVKIARINMIQNLKEWQAQAIDSRSSFTLQELQQHYSFILDAYIASKFDPFGYDPEVFAKAISDARLLKLYNSKINLTFVSKNKGNK